MTWTGILIRQTGLLYHFFILNCGYPSAIGILLGVFCWKVSFFLSMNILIFLFSFPFFPEFFFPNILQGNLTFEKFIFLRCHLYKYASCNAGYPVSLYCANPGYNQDPELNLQFCYGFVFYWYYCVC